MCKAASRDSQLLPGTLRTCSPGSAAESLAPRFQAYNALSILRRAVGVNAGGCLIWHTVKSMLNR